MKPKVSVIIPAHNEEKYIKNTLDAVLKNTYPNFEVIVAENGSTDKTADIVRQYPKIILEQTNIKGITKAREIGRLRATGTIIAQLDADSLVPIDWIEKGVEILSKKNTVACSGPYFYSDASLFFSILSFTIQVVFFTPTNFILQRLHSGAILIGSNIFIYKHVLDTMGGYDTNISFYGEDTDTAIKASKQGYVSFNPFLYIKSSARRFKKEGIIKTFLTYIKNFFSMITQEKPVTDNYKDHR